MYNNESNVLFLPIFLIQKTNLVRLLDAPGFHVPNIKSLAFSTS